MDLTLPLERAITVDDILCSFVGVWKRLARHFVLHCLIVSDQRGRREILERTRFDVLAPFKDCQRDRTKTLTTSTNASDSVKNELRILTLLRKLLKSFGGVAASNENLVDVEESRHENAALLASIFEVNATMPFGDFDPAEMREAFVKSRLYNEGNVPDVVKWSSMVQSRLPFGLSPELRICPANKAPRVTP
ncbi:MAG: hypothetical protein M1817_000681 [Caeruleum heppii]|nr:MAG: hypothetical protein M1817_000681 [Caeruleum heppii]